MYHNIEIRLKIGIFADYYCGILFNTIYSRTVSCAEGNIVRKKSKTFVSSLICSHLIVPLQSNWFSPTSKL